MYTNYTSIISPLLSLFLFLVEHATISISILSPSLTSPHCPSLTDRILILTIPNHELYQLPNSRSQICCCAALCFVVLTRRRSNLVLLYPAPCVSLHVDLTQASECVNETKRFQCVVLSFSCTCHANRKCRQRVLYITSLTEILRRSLWYVESLNEQYSTGTNHDNKLLFRRTQSSNHALHGKKSLLMCIGMASDTQFQILKSRSKSLKSLVKKVKHEFRFDSISLSYLDAPRKRGVQSETNIIKSSAYVKICDVRWDGRKTNIHGGEHFALPKRVFRLGLEKLVVTSFSNSEEDSRYWDGRLLKPDANAGYYAVCAQKEQEVCPLVW